MEQLGALAKNTKDLAESLIKNSSDQLESNNGENSILQEEEKILAKIRQNIQKIEHLIEEKHLPEDDKYLRDNRFSKNIRPFLAVSYTGFFFMVTLLSMKFSIPENIINVLGNIMIGIVAFYFGGRTVEKISSMIAPKFDSKR